MLACCVVASLALACIASGSAASFSPAAGPRARRRHLGTTPGFSPTYHGFDEWFGLPYSDDMGCVDQARARPPAPLH